MKVKIYHNPRCSKSRQTLEILNRKNLDIDIVEYLKSPLDINEISNLLKKLGYTARDLLRKGEDVYKNENLSDKSLTEDFLIDMMSKNPILIERPIVVSNGKAVIGRPPEKVLEILWQLIIVIMMVLERQIK